MSTYVVTGIWLTTVGLVLCVIGMISTLTDLQCTGYWSGLKATEENYNDLLKRSVITLGSKVSFIHPAYLLTKKARSRMAADLSKCTSTRGIRWYYSLQWAFLFCPLRKLKNFFLYILQMPMLSFPFSFDLHGSKFCISVFNFGSLDQSTCVSVIQYYFKVYLYV